ncbi:hypothetical protein [Daejeonella sp. JGW-45]|uniref:hypothetical protein n=1 Tax=Daejeonella sp. JGW-45 TaxID=3034148 RepID=UPI0023EB0862|nr:hypothetical protein [Daejeonella sp. JGW-45]
MHELYPLKRLRQFIFSKGGDDLPDTLNSVVYFFRNQLQYALKQDYELKEAAEHYNYRWDEKKQGFEVEIIYKNKRVEHFDSLKSHLYNVLKQEVRKEIDLIEFLNLDKDNRTKKVFAKNVQVEVSGLINDVSKENHGYSDIIVDSLNTLTTYLQKFGKLNSSPGKLGYKFRLPIYSTAVTRFLRKLTDYALVNCSLAEFRNFLESSGSTHRIIWLGNPTEFKSFIDKLCESRNNQPPYLSFTKKSKWLELENVFVLKDNYPFSKIKTLKKPAKSINDYLEDCMFELDSTQT